MSKEKITNTLNNLCEDIAEEILIVMDGKRIIASVLDETLAVHLKRKAERAEPNTQWRICRGIGSAIAYAWNCGYSQIFSEMMNQARKHGSGEDASNDAAPGDKGEENGEAEELRSGDVQQERESD